MSGAVILGNVKTIVWLQPHCQYLQWVYCLAEFDPVSNEYAILEEDRECVTAGRH